MPSHAAHHLDDRRTRDEAIVESLMIPFVMIVLDDVLGHGPPEMPLPDRNQGRPPGANNALFVFALSE
jgi:hypothetical protein